MYRAGHTNAAAQGVLEFLVGETSPEQIADLKIPQFVKEALLTLKDVADSSIGDDYSRSYLTAGLVARKFGEAAQEIKDNYDNPLYQKWLIALLRGMKTSAQPFSQQTYDTMLSFLELDKSALLQNEILQTLAFRVHNVEEVGINTRINPDFPLALDSLLVVMGREDF